VVDEGAGHLADPETVLERLIILADRRADERRLTAGPD
jgi:hypothetical protein